MSSTTTSLAGKKVLITGASSGIGAACAESFAREGSELWICARRLEPMQKLVEFLEEDFEASVHCFVLDVSEETEVVESLSALPPMDVLVNNAGTSAAGLFHDTSDETWKYDIELKVFGAIRCSRYAVPIMKKRGGGRIVNITTPGGKAPGAASVPTSVSRAAGIALTKEMSKDYAADNILVNTVCVWLIKSGQHETRWRNSMQTDPDLTLESFYQSLGSGVPVGRVGEAREVAGLIAFLVSERGGYITGTAINVDGGSSPIV